MFTIICLGKGGKLMLLAPNSFAGTLGGYAKVFIALPKISVNRSLSIIHGLVVAIVDDSPSHTAENGLDHI